MQRLAQYLLLTLLLSSFKAFGDDRLITDWRDWRAKYEQSLMAKDGWLSLAGLYWLEPGDNFFGSAKNNKIRFPDGTPSNLGNIHVKNHSMTLISNFEQLNVNGKYKPSYSLSATDNSRVKFPGYEFFIIEREGQFAIRLIEINSESSRKFAGADFFPFNQNWILDAKLIPHQKETFINIATVYGTNRSDRSAGWVEFEIDGKTHRLQAVDYGKEQPLYLFFSDLTNSDSTYGAGRYLKVAWPDSANIIRLDFNRAYNPPCAYTQYATCPLTPPQNRLPISIPAGELYAEKRE